MNWINIKITQLEEPEMIGAEPVQRATWLYLLKYCCTHENGGVISNARSWTDRQWLALGLTRSEVDQQCPLWSWGENGDLIVWRYPIESEQVVKAKREGGKKGGLLRGKSKVQSKGVLEGVLEGVPEGVLQRNSNSNSKGKDKDKDNSKDNYKRKESEEGDFLFGPDGHTEVVAKVSVPRKEPARPATAPVETKDPRHHEITSQIAQPYNHVTGKPFPFSPKFAKVLQRFLAGWNGTADEFLDAYHDAMQASTKPYAPGCLTKAHDPSFFCLNYAEVVAATMRVEINEKRQRIKAPF